MSEISISKDSAFLKKLDSENIKTYYVKIVILGPSVEYSLAKQRYLEAVRAYGANSNEAKAALAATSAINNEIPIREIQGRVSSGSITIDGSSTVRRAGNITFLAEEEENDLTDVDNLLSMNKKIKIYVGIENTVDKIHDEIIWFDQGIFIITQPSLSHSTTGVTINLQFKDKMCLLNGDCGGGLPASVIFDSYDQIIGLQDSLTGFPQNPNTYTVYGVNGSYYMWTAEKGWASASKDLVGTTVSVPQRLYDIIQTLVCNYGGEDLSKIIINDVELEIRNKVRYTGTETLYYNSLTGVYTLDSEEAANNEGEWIAYNYNDDCGYIYTDLVYPGTSGLVSSIGDNVCGVLDKIKTALGNYEYFYDVDGNFVFQEIKNYLNTTYEPVVSADRKYTLSQDGLILSAENYYMDLSNTSRSIYTFEEGSALLTAYSNTPSYTNIKNDYHIWGKNQDGTCIHYHIAIKAKPEAPYSTWSVVAETDDEGNYTGKLHIAGANEIGYDYTPTDWRAELYLQGAQKKALQQRPDIYEQELLDLFDAIYNMKEKKFKADIVNCPNELTYWFDYIEPTELYDISVDAVGPKIYSYQQEKIKKLYDADVPNVVMIDGGSSAISQSSLITKCESCGQAYSRVDSNIYSSISLGTAGYSAQEVARDLLYQYTDYSSAISITSIPIYYLDANNRITVYDRASGIYGDYVVKSISVPLDAKNTMSISATKALERV